MTKPPRLKNAGRRSSESTALRLAAQSTYQPQSFTRENLEKAIELLLAHKDEGSMDQEHSLRQVSETTSINPTTISEIRIGLVVQGRLFSQESYDPETVRKLWNEINDNPQKLLNKSQLNMNGMLAR